MDHKYIAALVAKSVFGNKNATLLTHKKIQTPTSQVFRLEYEVDEATHTLFVKFPLEGVDSKQTTLIKRFLRQEFQIAERVKSKFDSTPEMASISPAGYIEEIDGLITWEVRGNAFQDLISPPLHLRLRQPKTDLTRLSQLSGQWLQRFHSLNLTEDTSNFRQHILSYCEYRLDQMVAIENSQISKQLASSLMQNITLWVDDALSNPEVQIVLCHNDYSPHNIVVTDKGICVLDYSFSAPGLPAFDLACFWHKIEDLKWTVFRNKSRLDTLQNRFLSAYGSDFDWRRSDVKLGLTRLILSKMLTILRNRSFQPYGWIENRRRYSAYLKLLQSGFEMP